jgi:hypothetical protein
MCSQDVVITVRCKRPCKKLREQCAQIPRTEVRRNYEECGAMQHMDSLQGR